MATALDPDEVLRSTRGKEYFQRLARLLISGGTTLLREVFDQLCPPSGLPSILKSPVTEKQLKLAKLTKPQWRCLYPSPGTYGKSEDFDVTLLFRLLRNICNLTPPATGWDDLPTGTDHSLAADLARINYYRNSVYGHVSQNMKITDEEFLQLWQDIREALLGIAGQISRPKKHEWREAIDNFLHYPLTVEDQRNLEELRRWYRNDMEVKESIEKLNVTMHEGMERLGKSLKDVQEGTAHEIEKKGRFLENAVKEEAQGIKGELKSTTQNVQSLVRDEAQDIKDQLGGELKATTQNVQSLVREEAQDIKDQLGGELQTTTQNVQSLVREEAQDIKDQLGGELKATTQNVQSLVRDEAQDIKDQLGGELQTTTQNVQSLVREEAQDIKDQLGGELKTTTKNFQSLVREEAQEIKDKLDVVHQSIDGLRSTAGSSQASGVQIRLRMNCEAISGPSPRGGASEIVTTSREPQPSVQSETVMPVTSYQQQASPMAGFGGENFAYGGLPRTQEVMNFIAHKYFQNVDPSKPEELNGFLQYLRDVRKVLLVDTQRGSLILILECSSLEILEGLWTDYRSGHLNEMAQKYLVTEEILEEFGVITVKLMTTILVEEYTACREYFLQSAVHSPRYITRESAMGSGPQVETSDLTLDDGSSESESESAYKLESRSERNPFQFRAKGYREEVDVVQKSIYGLRSRDGSSQACGAQIRVRMDCEAISGPGSARKAPEIVRTAQEPRSWMRTFLESIASYVYPQQASPMVDFGGQNLDYAGLLSLRLLNFIACKYFQAVDPSKPEELNGFLQYLKDVRKVLFVDVQQGSLIITLECSSLEILDGLWEDYCSGHLNEVAQKYLVTEEALKEFDLIEVKLKTTILAVEYNRCREYFLQSGVHPPQYITRERAARFDPPVETSKSFSVPDPVFEYPQTIFVMMPGKTIALMVEPSDSIRHVKRLIEEKENIACYKQRLTFAGQQLQDEHSLFHYDIGKKSTLQLDDSGIFVSVEVKAEKTQFTLRVRANDTIEHFKELIQDEVGIPPDEQILQIFGSRVNDRGSLWDKGIRDRSCVAVIKGMRIFIKIPPGETITLLVEPNDTIGSVKEMLKRYMVGTPPDEQSLTSNGMELEKERTLKDYNIEPQSTLYLARKSHQKYKGKKKNK